jgi:hypothetical protein
VTTVKYKIAFAGVLALVVLCAAPLHAAGSRAALFKNKAVVDKNYFLLLFGFKFLLPEVVNLDFNDNGTFALNSDLYDAPARGSYDKGLILIRGEGATGRFYDVDFQEEISIDYSLVGMPIGFQGFYIMGIGKRDFTFYSDGFSVSETFIFQGPGS